MPVAVVTTEITRRDLKSLAGGWVDLRTLTYGQKMERASLTSTMTMRGQGKRNFEAEMQMMNEQVTLLAFKYCVVDHNLTDEREQKLNLSDPNVIRSLHPQVGEEISTMIDELNNFEADEETGN